PAGTPNSFYFGRYDIIAAWNYKNQERVTEVDENSSQLVTTTNYFYENPSLSFLTKTESLNSKQELVRTTFSYAGDHASEAPYSQMIGRFQINPVVQQNKSINDAPVEARNTNYKDWGNGIITPETIRRTVQNNQPYTQLQLYRYDIKGNPLE